MLLGWLNRADGAMVTVSSELSSLPGSNVQHPHVARQWQTAAGVKSAYVIFDMGMEISCQLLGVMGSNLTAAGTVRISASSADPTVTSSLLQDTGDVATTAKEGYGQSYHDCANAVAARYWRIGLADYALPDNLHVGRIFLGPRWEPSVVQEKGWQVTPIDPSTVDESYGGQGYADQRSQRRKLEFSLSFMNADEMFGNAFALARAVGVVGDVLAVNNSAGNTWIAEQSVFGRLTVSAPTAHEIAKIFRQKFTVMEAL